MYFESRAQAGYMLAEQLVEKYRYENCAVVALSDGAVQVGEQIASALHCILTMLVIENIQIPGENMSFGAMSQSGNLTYNTSLSPGELEEYTGEFHGYLEEQKREAMQRINRLVGEGGIIDADMLRDHTVILVSDGLDSSGPLDVAVEFLKPVRVNKLVVATPIATVPIVDKLHIMADELHVLDVKENFLGVDHYYEKNDIPTHEETIAKINQIILNWR
ncbi:MAG TPA: phosphoribosyltransferase family protein [Candidatus Saccharimonadales bacterium]|nr:phosphoribosyltransferase family protein [Candidatus Saccharimonadales bacterium]